jgi:hypothetical protein
MHLPSLLLTFFTFFFFMGHSASTPMACNGNTAICSQQYSSVVQIGTHDSAFVGVLPTDNQEVSVASQLDAGIRFLQAQTHEQSGELYLCHTTCSELNAGPLTNYLTTIKTWIDSNPDQVVTLLLTNGDRVDVDLFGSAMQSTGLATYAYTPPHQLAISEWPTLQELIDDGTRLVMFLGGLSGFPITYSSAINCPKITSQIQARFHTSSMSSVTFSKQLTTLPTSILVLSIVHLALTAMAS